MFGFCSLLTVAPLLVVGQIDLNTGELKVEPKCLGQALSPLNAAMHGQALISGSRFALYGNQDTWTSPRSVGSYTSQIPTTMLMPELSAASAARFKVEMEITSGASTSIIAIGPNANM